MIDGDTIYLHNVNMNWRRDKYTPASWTRGFCWDRPNTFGPTDLTSMYTTCTGRVFGDIGHRNYVLRSTVQCPNH
ncbi:hypothetical protein TNCV_245231 [Trichonephila clavipes]|nr:hypothetical protein TNCV_245231 [Trichonephila clavipes]